MLIIKRQKSTMHNVQYQVITRMLVDTETAKLVANHILTKTRYVRICPQFDSLLVEWQKSIRSSQEWHRNNQIGVKSYFDTVLLSQYCSIYLVISRMAQKLPNWCQIRYWRKQEWSLTQKQPNRCCFVHSQPFDPLAAVMNGMFANSKENARHRKVLRETRLTETSMKLILPSSQFKSKEGVSPVPGVRW